MIPKLTIYRGPSTPEGTFSVARFESASKTFNIRTIELPWKDNERGVSCIPTGTYMARIRLSPNFKREVFLLEGVPGRDMIEIHPANFAGDVSLGWQSELNGCIAPGFGVSLLPNVKGIQQRCVSGSRRALDRLIESVDDEMLVEIVGDRRGG